MRNEARVASELLADLDANYLEVVLIPSRDYDCAMRGGKIRAVQYQNAQWYREFCALYPSARNHRRRKFQTKIKRSSTRRALVELVNGTCRTEYAQRLRAFIKRQAQRVAA
jgi:crotonobetainyl-CoA:carnitine CoA-transferase CaiB-like acyl-CoA transferase